MNDTELQAKLDDIQEQLTYLFRLHGPATWAHIQKQRRDNAKAQGTRLSISPSQAHGEVPSGKPLAS